MNTTFSAFGSERDTDFAVLIHALQTIPGARHQMPVEDIIERLSIMRQHGYTAFGVFGQESLLAACGCVYGLRFYTGQYVHIDNFAVRSDRQGQGYGRQLLASVLEDARRKGCASAILDAYVQNSQAHRFYFREGFHIKGFHFYRDLTR